MKSKEYKKLHSIFKDKPKKMYSLEYLKRKINQNLHIELKKLIKNKVVIETYDKKYILNTKNILIGEILNFASVTYNGDEYEISNCSKESLLIGDKIFFILKKGYASCINIFKRHETVFVGRLEYMHNFAFFVTSKKIFYKDPIIEYENLKNAKDGDLVSAKIIKWPLLGDKSSRGKGIVEKIFGSMDDPNNQINALLRQNEIKQRFHQGIREDVRKLSEYKKNDDNRVDLRKQTIVTIDPDDAKDFDDAVSVEKHDNFYRLGVHIADVSYYIKPNSKLDIEAETRGNSTYLVGRVIPMLPERLSNDLCSLKPNVDRPAFTAEIDIDFDGKIISSKFYESLIKSKKRFTYKEAQSIIDGEAESKFSIFLGTLKKVALILMDRTNKRGYINFNLPELEIILNSNREPKSINVKKELFAHRMIEEFMLLANEEVAKFISNKKINSIYRVHDKPEISKLNETFEYFSGFGLHFPHVSTIEPINIQHILNSIENDSYQYLINDQLLRTMQKAIYTPLNRGHFGLALDNYTHFTSPIRRYADLIIHRILKHILKGGNNDLYSFEELNKISNDISEKERKSMTLERESVKLKTMEYMKNFIGAKYSGFVSGVIKSGFFVQLRTMPVEGFVPFRTIDNLDVKSQSDSKIFYIGKEKIHIGKLLKIEVFKIDISRRMLDFKLINIEV